MVEARGGKVLWMGKADQVLIGDPSRTSWDSVALVQYPSRKAFIDMVTTPDYEKAHEHRESGLERTVLIACTPRMSTLDVTISCREFATSPGVKSRHQMSRLGMTRRFAVWVAIAQRCRFVPQARGAGRVAVADVPRLDLLQHPRRRRASRTKRMPISSDSTMNMPAVVRAERAADRGAEHVAVHRER